MPQNIIASGPTSQKHRSKKRLLLIVSVAAFLVACSGGALYAMYRSHMQSPTVATDTSANPSGGSTTPSQNHKSTSSNGTSTGSNAPSPQKPGSSTSGSSAGSTTPSSPSSPTSPTTPTSPTSPTTPSGSCISGAANAPGTADPWGGCWPGPQNTGYPHGVAGDTRHAVTLTNYTGPQVITSCGVVIDSKIVSWLVINASNGTHSPNTPCVTIKNSLVNGTVTNYNDSSYGPIVVSDTEVNSDGDLPFAENLGRYNFFTYRVNSHGGQGVIKCAAYCETKDNWVHGMTLGGSYHYNAIGGNGMEAGSWLIDHNWTSCGDWESVASNFDQSAAGCSAVIGFYGDFDPVRNITINHNYLKSAFNVSASGSPNRDNQAAYCLNPGYYVGKPYPNPTNMTITNNIFARSASGNCAIFGPTNSLNKIGLGSTNVWSGNTYDDGTVISRVEE